jgi:putative hydrolase of the HAD superfamily
MLDKYEGIVFDVDDTLYLERDYVRSGFGAVGKFIFQEFQLPGFGDACWSQFENGGRGDIFNLVLDEFHIESNTELVQELLQTYRVHTPEIFLLPDSLLLLNAVSPRMPVGFLTGGSVISQRKKVEALGLQRYSGTIVYAGDLGANFDKPHPRSWESTEESMGIPADRLLYIGDNPLKDFAAPIRLGWGVARVRRSGGLHFRVPGLREVREVSLLSELAQWKC